MRTPIILRGIVKVIIFVMVSFSTPCLIIYGVNTAKTGSILNPEAKQNMTSNFKFGCIQNIFNFYFYSIWEKKKILNQ